MASLIDRIKYMKDLKVQYNFMVEQSKVQSDINYKPWKSLKHPFYVVKSALSFGYFDTVKIQDKIHNSSVLFSSFMVSLILAALTLVFDWETLSGLLLFVSLVLAGVFSHHSYTIAQDSLDEGLNGYPDKTQDFLDYIETEAYKK